MKRPVIGGQVTGLFYFNVFTFLLLCGKILHTLKTEVEKDK